MTKKNADTHAITQLHKCLNDLARNHPHYPKARLIAAVEGCLHMLSTISDRTNK